MRDKGFFHQATSWSMARRVVIPQSGIEFHAGELFHRVGFIATNLELPSQGVERFYNQRSTVEVAVATIKEGKRAVN